VKLIEPYVSELFILFRNRSARVLKGSGGGVACSAGPGLLIGAIDG
jgi:hypothetical protein